MTTKKYNPMAAMRSGARSLFGNKGPAFLLLALLLGLFGLPDAHAVLDTNITGIVTDLTAFFGTISTLVISVVVFSLAIGYAKMLRKK